MKNDTLYFYDNIGRLICEKSPRINGMRIKKTVRYDDELNTVVSCDANGNYTRTEYTDLGYEYKTYLAQGLYPQGNDILVKECCYDENCRMVKEIFYDGYDTRKENIRSETRYIYDCFDRIVSKEIPQADYMESYVYTPVCDMPYDANEKGYMVTKTVHGQTGAPDIVTETYYNMAGQENAVYIGGSLYNKKKHNLAGTLTEITDALGNTTRYIADYEQRVIEEQRPYNNGYVSSFTEYDAVGNKVSQTDFMGNTTSYYYDSADRVIKKISPFDTQNAEQIYAYNPCGKLTYEATKIAQKNWRYTAYAYDSFGNIINPASVGDPNDPIYVDQSPFGYAGEYLDKENGEIYLRARYYSSEHGRFVTEDPSHYGANWYSYCDNNPVTKADRTGLRPTTDGSANSDKYANDYMKETYPKQNQSVSKAPTTPPPQTSPAPQKSSSKSSAVSAPTHVKYYNIDHKENELPFFDSSVLKEIQEAATVGENNSTFRQEFSASVIQSTAVNAYEAVDEGLIKLSSVAYSNSYVGDMTRTNSTIYSIAGIFIDFAGQFKENGNVAEAALMAAGHFATYMVVGIMVKAFVLSHLAPSLIVIAGIILASTMIASAITTYVDRGFK